MEHTSDMVYEGKTIEDNSYTKRSDRYREISIEHRHILDTLSETVTLTAKIDYYDPKQGVVHEIKKSEARQEAHIRQVQFYLFVLRQKGLSAEYGIIEYPKLRSRTEVFLSDEDILHLRKQIEDIRRIISNEMCPPSLPKYQCSSCSYFDFCWVSEI